MRSRRNWRLDSAKEFNMRIVCNGGHRERTEESTGGEHEIRLDHVNQMDTYIRTRHDSDSTKKEYNRSEWSGG